MDVRPFLSLDDRVPVALETRGCTVAQGLAWLARAHGPRATPIVLLPLTEPMPPSALSTMLARVGVGAAQVALTVPGERLTAPGMQETLADARTHGVRVLVGGVGGDTTALGTVRDRPGDVLVLAPEVWAGAQLDGRVARRLGHIVGLARQLGWEVWAQDVASAVDLPILRGAGVRAACGPALAPWTPAEAAPPAPAPPVPFAGPPAAHAPAPAPAPAPPQPPAPAAGQAPVPPALAAAAHAPGTATTPAAARAPAAVSAHGAPSTPRSRPPRRGHRGRLIAVVGVLALALVLAVQWGFLPWVGDDQVAAPVVDGGHGQLARRGFNLTAWGSNDYNSRHARQALQEATKLGANTVAIVVTQYVDDVHATDIHRVDDKTPTDRSLERIIRLAKQMGFYVSIKPHVDTVSGDWRGDIAPADFDAFADSYRAFILHYAQIAQDVGAPELIAGTELKAVTRQMAQAGNGGDELIREIREVFDGTVGYAANWDNIDYVPFWKNVDFIGIDAYYPLGTSDDVDDLVTAWQPYVDQAVGLAHQYDKPLVLTEAGYQNRAGASDTPWGVPSDATLDDQAQVNALQALFIAWGDVPELQGIYLWQLYAGNPADLDPGDWSVVGKPAADTVSEGFDQGG